MSQSPHKGPKYISKHTAQDKNQADQSISTNPTSQATHAINTGSNTSSNVHTKRTGADQGPINPTGGQGKQRGAKKSGPISQAPSAASSTNNDPNPGSKRQPKKTQPKSAKQTAQNSNVAPAAQIASPSPEELRKREEEAQKRAEEESAARLAAQKQAEEELQRVEMVNAAAAELKSRQHLRWLRMQNLQAEQSRPPPSHFKSLNSTIGKCSAYARKCNKISADTLDSLLKELRTLNLNKYVSEVATNIASASLKPTDLDAAVTLCSELNRLYADFATDLYLKIIRLISPTSKTELSPRRMALRLYIELFIAGVFHDELALVSTLKEVIDQKDPKQLATTLQLVLSLVRSGGRDILGIIPKSMETKIEAFQDANLLQTQQPQAQNNLTPGTVPEEDQSSGSIATTSSHINSAEQLPYEPILEDIISAERRTQLVGLVNVFYQKVSAIFVQSHRKLREIEQKNQELLVTRHELSSEASNAYTKQLEQFENFQKTLMSLSDMLHLEMPSLPQQEKLTRIKEPSKNLAGSSADVDEFDGVQGPWESEEARRFYEVLPDLKDFLPSSLLSVDPRAPDAATTTESNASTATTMTTATALLNSEEPNAKPIPIAMPATEPKQSTGEGGATPDALGNFFEKLMRCSNRQLIDDAAMEFVKFNQKSWRVRLANLMHQAPRNRLDNLRYFSRFVAILNPYFKDIGSTLVKKLEEEFEFLYKQKDQTNSPSKLWNARFLSELTKFKICPPNTVLTFLKRCLDDFIGYNVHVACELVDTCGRYLLNMPETRVRTSNLLDHMAQLKTSRQFHVTLEILIDNALQTARPVERAVKQVASLPPVQLYIHKLLYLDLRKDTLSFVVSQLKRLPWSQEEPFLLKTMLKLYKNKYQHIRLIAAIVSQISSAHESFAVKFLDHLLEDIRVHLETRSFNSHQKLVMNVALAGELINVKICDAKLLYKLLYSFIRYNTITFPKSGPSDLSFTPSKDSATNPRESQREAAALVTQAWIEDSFRIRLVCTLLTTCRMLTTFDSLAKTQARDMEAFLLFFQRFLFLQHYISPEMHSLLDDTWHVVRPPYLAQNMPELELKLKSFLATKPTCEGNDERFSLPYKITPNTQNNFVDDEDDADVAVEADNTNINHLQTEEIGPDSESHLDIPAKATPTSPVVDLVKQQEDELAKNFDSLMQDSMSVRTNVNTRTANSIFSVPLMALKRKAEIIKPSTPEPLVIPSIVPDEENEEEEDDEGDSDEDYLQEEVEEMEEGEETDSEESEESEEDESDDDVDVVEDVDVDLEAIEGHTIHQEQLPRAYATVGNVLPQLKQSATTDESAQNPKTAPAMAFQILGRKPGNKPILGHINIPTDSSMVKRHLQAQEIAQQQREAMTAVTMKLYQMGEEADAKRDSDARLHMTAQRPSPKPQSTTYAAAVEALSTSAPRKSFTPQIDPVVPKSRPKK